MTSPARISIMTGEDAAAVAALEAECFSEPWSEESLRDMAENRLTLYLKAEIDGKLVGYCGTQIVLDEGDLLRIAVSAEYRKYGIASAMLDELWRRTEDVTLWNLDVRESNIPAQGLYHKYGFEAMGRRKKYYHKPEEDAITMQRKK